jgi:membrane protein YdbS with pleckstrin-like domain
MAGLVTVAVVCLPLDDVVFVVFFVVVFVLFFVVVFVVGFVVGFAAVLLPVVFLAVVVVRRDVLFFWALTETTDEKLNVRNNMYISTRSLIPLQSLKFC